MTYTIPTNTLCVCYEITTHLRGTVGQTLARKIQFYDLQNRACRYINGVLRCNPRDVVVATALTEQHVRVLWHRSFLVVPVEGCTQWCSQGVVTKYSYSPHRKDASPFVVRTFECAFVHRYHVLIRWICSHQNNSDGRLRRYYVRKRQLVRVLGVSELHE